MCEFDEGSTSQSGGRVKLDFAPYYFILRAVDCGGGWYYIGLLQEH